MTSPVNTEAALPSPKVTVLVKTTGPVTARPLLALKVLAKLAPPESSAKAADASVVSPSALTAPLKPTRPVPALTVSR